MTKKFFIYFMFCYLFFTTTAISGIFHCEKLEFSQLAELKTQYMQTPLRQWPLSIIDNPSIPHTIFDHDDLDLSNQNLDDWMVTWLAQALPDKSTFRKLDLSGNNLSDNSIADLSTIIANIQLDDLDLGSNDLSARGIYRLGLSLQNSTVHTLCLGNSELAAIDAKVLGQCLEGIVVKTLKVYWNYFGGIGARDLVQALFKSYVTTLDLSYNNIGNSGINILAPTLANSSLHTLILSYNRISKPLQQRLIKDYPYINFEFEK